MEDPPAPPCRTAPRRQARLSLTHEDGGGHVPGVVGALPLAILGALGVQLEDGLLEGGKDGRWAGGGSRGPQRRWGRLTSACWPASTKAQTGWKAPVPQAYRWVRL